MGVSLVNPNFKKAMKERGHIKLTSAGKMEWRPKRLEALSESELMALYHAGAS